MTTSGSVDFQVTTADIVRDALLLLNAIDPGENIPDVELRDGKRTLNMLSKYLQTLVEVWPTKDIQVDLTPGKESYTVGESRDIDEARFLKLRNARRESSDGLETQIEVISRNEYNKLPNKASEGPVNVVYYDSQLSPATLYVWPTGDTSNQILHLVVSRPLEDFDTVSNTPDYPQEWYMCLVYQLASTLSPVYKGSVDSGLKQVADQYLRALRVWDTEPGSIRISPNMHRYRS